MPVADANLEKIFSRTQRSAAPSLDRELVRIMRDLSSRFSRVSIRQAARTGNLQTLFASPAWQEAEEALVRLWADPDGKLYRAAVRSAEQTYRASFPGAIDRLELERRVGTWLEQRGRDMASRMVSGTKQSLVEAMRLAERTKHEKLLSLSLEQRRHLALATERGALRVGYSPNSAGTIWKEIEESADILRGRSGISKLRRKADKRLTRKLRERGKVFALTETVSAGNRGQLEAWVKGADDGEIDEDDYVLEWVVAGPRPCPRCIAFGGTTRELRGGFFTSRRGEVAEQPEIHPNGRCRMRLVKRSEARAAA